MKQVLINTFITRQRWKSLETIPLSCSLKATASSWLWFFFFRSFLLRALIIKPALSVDENYKQTVPNTARRHRGCIRLSAVIAGQGVFNLRYSANHETAIPSIGRAKQGKKVRNWRQNVGISTPEAEEIWFLPEIQDFSTEEGSLRDAKVRISTG